MRPGRATFVPLILLALDAVPGRAQVVSGRVADSLGVPIAHAHVFARPENDSSEVALRVANTKERGEFRLRLGVRGVARISVLRIGFRPDSGRRVDLSKQDAELNIVMSSVPLMLAAIHVAPREPRCVSLESDQQSPDVRDLVREAQDILYTRRAIERDYAVEVHETSKYTKNDQRKNSERTYTRSAGDSSRDFFDEAFARQPVGRAFTGRGSGGTSWITPAEGLFLSPAFSRRLCYDNAVFPLSGGQEEIRFRQVDSKVGELALAGSLKMTPDAMITEISFRMLSQGRRVGQGTLSYVPMAIGGEQFPLIARRVQQTFIAVHPIGSPFLIDLRDGGRVDVSYTYSTFLRRR